MKTLDQKQRCVTAVQVSVRKAALRNMATTMQTGAERGEKVEKKRTKMSNK